MSKRKPTPAHYFLFSVRYNRRNQIKRELRVMDYVEKMLSEGHTRRDLFLDMADAHIEKTGGQVAPPKRIIAEQSFDEFLKLMTDIKDALRNAQLNGQVITSIDVDRFESGLTEIQEAWDTSHLGKEGEFYD